MKRGPMLYANDVYSVRQMEWLMISLIDLKKKSRACFMNNRTLRLVPFVMFNCCTTGTRRVYDCVYE